jgi:hypothetical protein
VQSGAIIESFDVIEDEEPRLVPGPKAVVVEPLGLERVEETFGYRIVEAVTRPAHAANDSVAIEEILVVGAEVRSSAIGVKNEARLGPPSLKGILQSFDCELLALLSRGSPTDDAARVEIEDYGQGEPSFLGADLCDVRDPDPIGSRGDEFAVESIWSGGHFVAPGGDELETPLRAAANPFAPHHARHAVLTELLSLIAQNPVHTRRAVDPATLAVDQANLLGEDLVLFLPAALTAFGPGVEAAAGDPEFRAHRAYSEGPPILLDEAKLHFCSSAK